MSSSCYDDAMVPILYSYNCSLAVENRARSLVLLQRNVMFFRLCAVLMSFFYLAEAPIDPDLGGGRRGQKSLYPLPPAPPPPPSPFLILKVEKEKGSDTG